MAVKNIYIASVVQHNDTVISGQSPITYNQVFVIARTPSQVSSKLMKVLGDKLLFIENIEFAGSNDESVFACDGTNVRQLVG